MLSTRQRTKGWDTGTTKTMNRKNGYLLSCRRRLGMMIACQAIDMLHDSLHSVMVETMGWTSLPGLGAISPGKYSSGKAYSVVTPLNSISLCQNIWQRPMHQHTAREIVMTIRPNSSSRNFCVLMCIAVQLWGSAAEATHVTLALLLSLLFCVCHYHQNRRRYWWCTSGGVYKLYLAFTCMPGESYRRRLMFFLLCLCYVFRQALVNSFVC